MRTESCVFIKIKTEKERTIMQVPRIRYQSVNPFVKNASKYAEKFESKAQKALPKEFNANTVKAENKQMRRLDFECGEGNNYEYFIHLA